MRLFLDFTFGSILWPKTSKNTPLDFKIQKKTQLLSERSLGKVDGHKLKNTSINKRFLLKVNGHGLKMTFQESIIGQAERGRTNLKIHAG